MTPGCDTAMADTVTFGIQAGKSISCFKTKPMNEHCLE